MAYDDDKYIKAHMALTDSVHELLDNEISASDIHEMVDSAIGDYEPEED